MYEESKPATDAIHITILPEQGQWRAQYAKQLLDYIWFNHVDLWPQKYLV